MYFVSTTVHIAYRQKLVGFTHPHATISLNGFLRNTPCTDGLTLF